MDNGDGTWTTNNEDLSTSTFSGEDMLFGLMPSVGIVSNTEYNDSDIDDFIFRKDEYSSSEKSF
jgi:hypothetical protein